MPNRSASSPHRATIYDVAAEAGVAISTVSRVLNGSPEVSEQTRERVQAVIEKLRFQPQRIARTLAQQSTVSLAVAMPSATSLFYVEVLKGVKDVLRERDIDLLLCNLGSVAPNLTLQRFLNRGAVGSLLLASLPVDDALAEQLLRMHAPVVLLGSRYEGFDEFYWDDEGGARLATRHLIGLGHERIGMISAHPWSYNAEGRLRGYRTALEEAGLPFDPELIVTGETRKHAGYSEEAGAEAMAKLMALPERPTAVFASSDVQAYGAYAYARDNSIRVPRDVSLVGYDNLKLSRYLDLTTVDQRMYDAGRDATQRLLARMLEPETTPRTQEIPLALVERGSTAPPRAR